MDEDKQKICDLLLPAVQATRGGSDVTALEYIGSEISFLEYVDVRSQNGFVRRIDVSGDSGCGMIRDIMKNLGC